MKLLLLFVAATASAQPKDFVRVDGARFVVADRPFVFVGANLEVMHGAANRAAAAATINAAAADGLTVGRIWALGEGASGATPDRSTIFRAGPDVLVDDAMAQLDSVVAAASRAKLRLIVVLANNWADYGGLPMYLRWFGLDDERDHDRFYDDPRVRAAFLAHVDRVVARYADNPTVMAWELINESHVDGDGAARLAFIDEIAAHIKTLAPRQLVSAGIFGYGTRSERAQWLAACRRPLVDYCDSHFYAETADSIGAPVDLDDAIDDRAQLAHFVARKPLVLGEIGFDTRRATRWFLGLSRFAWFRRALARVRADAVDGALVWIYQPFAAAERDFGIYTDRHDTDDIRAALRAAAADAALAPVATNRRLGPQAGDKPLYAIYKTVHFDSVVQIGLFPATEVVELDPTRPRSARFERVGRYEPPSPRRPHAYGDGDGSFRWDFTLGRAATSLSIELRASAESPGTHGTVPSDFAIRLDGKLIARRRAPPDDGAGVLLTVDVRRRISAGRHRLSLDVDAGPAAHGLSLYGPEPITLTFRR